MTTEATITITIAVTLPASEAKRGYARQLIDSALDRTLSDLENVEPNVEDEDDDIPLGTGDLSAKALERLWHAINSVPARATLTLMATRPEGYIYDELYDNLDATGQKVGGWLSSIGFAVARTEVRASPIVREWREGQLWYSMDPEAADFILKLAAEDRPVQAFLLSRAIEDPTIQALVNQVAES